jgi:hypothetical protein
MTFVDVPPDIVRPYLYAIVEDPNRVSESQAFARLVAYVKAERERHVSDGHVPVDDADRYFLLPAITDLQTFREGRSIRIGKHTQQGPSQSDH